MKNLQNIINNLSTKDISFIVDLNRLIQIDQSGKISYFKFQDTIYPFQIKELSLFLKNIDNNKVYMIFPFISKNCIFGDPYLALARPFMITNKSNIEIIANFLNYQFEIAINNFEIQINTENLKLLFAYKEIYLSYKTF